LFNYLKASLICFALYLSILFISPNTCKADTPEELPVAEEENLTPEPIILEGKTSSPPNSTLSTVLLYLPNRIFDLLDIVRARVRVGPGLGVGIRMTEPLSIYAGAHATIYAGLPGPRQERTIPLPLGAEAVAGGRLSVLNGIYCSDTSSRHSQTEVGLELQVLLVGVDISIDPVEFADFLTGFFLFELRDDDL